MSRALSLTITRVRNAWTEKGMKMEHECEAHSEESGWAEKIDRKIAEGIERTGYYVVGVGAGPKTPSFFYSVGFYKHGHPEIVLTSLAPDNAHGMIASCYHLITDHDRCFTDGSESDEVANMPVRFRLTSPDPTAMPYTFCDRYYGHFVPRLQLIWPDTEGHFPGDPECDKEMAAAQVIT